MCLKCHLNEFKEINDRAAIQTVQIIQVIRNRLIVLLEEKLLKVSMLISFLLVATNATNEYIPRYSLHIFQEQIVRKDYQLRQEMFSC